MILVDTSIWIDHFRTTDARLADLLAEDRAMLHPFVLGELAMGSLRPRAAVLEALQRLPSLPAVSMDEFLSLLDRENLYATGLSFVDAHLLASLRIHGSAQLWSRDRRLHAAAERMSLPVLSETTD